MNESFCVRVGALARGRLRFDRRDLQDITFGPCDPVGDGQTRTSWETSAAVYWVLSSREKQGRRGKGRASEANSVGTGSGGERDGRVEAFALLTDVCWLLIWATNPIEMTSGWSVGLFFWHILCAQPNILSSSDAQMKSF